MGFSHRGSCSRLSRFSVCECVLECTFKDESRGHSEGTMKDKAGKTMGYATRSMSAYAVRVDSREEVVEGVYRSTEGVQKESAQDNVAITV